MPQVLRASAHQERSFPLSRRWRDACAEANETDRADGKKLKEGLKAKKQKVKELEADLRRKERALAETSALLVLRKKAAAIWGDGGED